MKLSTLLRYESSLGKLLNYGYLPARQNFHLFPIREQIVQTLDAYDTAVNALRDKYGVLNEEKNVYELGENKEAYWRELSDLEAQETDISFPEDKITLCVESIEKAEIGLPADKRLGFSANDWAAISEIIKVTEAEG